MKAPKFYARIKTGYFMCGMHGFSSKRNAAEFMENWIRAQIKSGVSEDKAYDAIRVESA